MNKSEEIEKTIAPRADNAATKATEVDASMTDANDVSAATTATATATSTAGVNINDCVDEKTGEGEEHGDDTMGLKPAATDAPATTTDITTMPSTAATPTATPGTAGKKSSRTTSPTVAEAPSSAAAMSGFSAASALQAVSAANLAAAAQLASALQLHGLLLLLTQTSPSAAMLAPPPTAAAASDATTAGGSTSLLPGSISAGAAVSPSLMSSSWMLPSPDQVRQAATKAIQDAPPFVHLSKTDSAPQLKIVDDRRWTLKGGMRGYRMSRATHGVSAGHYYYEVLVLPPPSIQEIVAALPANARLGRALQQQIQEALTLEQQAAANPAQSTATTGAVESQPASTTGENAEHNSNNAPNRKRKADDAAMTPPSPPQVGGHLRIGWSMRTGDLQAPVGYDKWSYGFRSLLGSKLHQSRRDDQWGGESWGPGDVVGCAIWLNGNASAASNAPHANNHIRFFKNGEAMGQFVISKGKREGGAAFENIQEGTYYPAISSYLGGSVKVNFGPYFVYPPRKLPHGITKLHPVSDLCPPPLTETEILARLKPHEKSLFSASRSSKTPVATDKMMLAFKDAVLAEVQVLRDAYVSHRRRHLQEVLEARQARNLSVTDVQQVLDEEFGTKLDGDAPTDAEHK